MLADKSNIYYTGEILFVHSESSSVLSIAGDFVVPNALAGLLNLSGNQPMASELNR